MYGAYANRIAKILESAQGTTHTWQESRSRYPKTDTVRPGLGLVGILNSVASIWQPVAQEGFHKRNKRDTDGIPIEVLQCNRRTIIGVVTQMLHCLDHEFQRTGKEFDTIEDNSKVAFAAIGNLGQAEAERQDLVWLGDK